MAAINVYLDDDEALFVRAQRKGFVRELVHEAMDVALYGESSGDLDAVPWLPGQKLYGGEEDPAPAKTYAETVEHMESVKPTIPGVKPCPKCGTLITEKQTSHGKCGWKQS